jgi:hypothetical protein
MGWPAAFMVVGVALAFAFIMGMEITGRWPGEKE